jgi:hypothetical protein
VSPDRFDRISPDNGICATVVTFYAALYPALRETARQHGYALALHGSLGRDLDLVAVPWVEDAAHPETLVAALTETAGGFAVPQAVAEKPHGRVAVVIALGRSGGMIDLSIMPRAA